MTWTRLLCWWATASVTTETPTKWSPSWRGAIFGSTPNCGTKSGQYRSTLYVSITESHSDLEFSGTADLGEDGGRTFHVVMDYQAHGGHFTHIIRKNPKP
jgi:hypothetical protein